MIFDNLRKMARFGRKKKQPVRETDIYPRLMQTLAGQRVAKKTPVFKPTPWNLRAFSRTPFARRAINTIKNPIAGLAWEIVSDDGKENSETKRQAEIITRCLMTPNADDSWRSFIERLIEDIFCGSGAYEQQVSSDENRPLWLFPVDGLSIQLYPCWIGQPDEPKYCQIPGYGLALGGGQGINLRNDELVYIAPNPSTSTPFGCGQMEIAFMTISRLLGAEEFAGNTATNARPNVILNFGNMTNEQMTAFRAYWRNEIEGQAVTPMANLGKDATILRLQPEGDAAMFLQWQEVLKRCIAAAFDISPQNLGIERDLNRNTSEVAEDRDWDQAIIPMARLLEDNITRHTIKDKMGFSTMRFRFVGLDREDELNTAKIYETRYKNNSITPDEFRDRLGEKPMEGEWGTMTFADTQIAMQAARGTGEIDDPDLPPPRAGSSNSAVKKKPKKKDA